MKKELVNKSDISGFIDNYNLDKKTATLKSKSKLKADKDKILKFQAFDSNYICDKSYFEDDGILELFRFSASS